MSNDYDPNYVAEKIYAVVGLKAILTNSAGQILSVKRSDKLDSGGKWSLPGGGIDKYEDADTGIKREISEEIQIEIDQLKPYTVRSAEENDGQFSLVIGYIGHVRDDQEVKLNWEHDEFVWLSKEDALKLDLTSGARYFIEKFDPNSF